MKEFWIDHPSQGGPVSLRRWALWKIACALDEIRWRVAGWQRRLEHRALYDEPLDDEIPF